MAEIRQLSVKCTKCELPTVVDPSDFFEHYGKCHMGINMFKCMGCEKTFATPFYASLHPCKSNNKKVELILDLTTKDAQARLMALQKGYNDAVKGQSDYMATIFRDHVAAEVKQAKKECADKYAARAKQISRHYPKDDDEPKPKSALVFKDPTRKGFPEEKKKSPTEEDEGMESVSFVYGGRDEPPKAKKAKTEEVTKEEFALMRHMIPPDMISRLNSIMKNPKNPDRKGTEASGKGDVQMHIRDVQSPRDKARYVSQNTQQSNVTVTIDEEFPVGKNDRGSPLKQRGRVNDRASFPGGKS